MSKIKDNSSSNINDKDQADKKYLNINSESYSENDISKLNDKELLNKKKIIKEKCYFCNKKLKMIHFTCRCYHKFCIIHQNPHSHRCTYDSKSAKKDEIKNNNPKLCSKVDQI